MRQNKGKLTNARTNPTSQSKAHLAARDQQGKAEGLFLAAWAGHNAQSHNHNDARSFIIFTDGKPIAIDIGRPTYRRQTFSNRHYEI